METEKLYSPLEFYLHDPREEERSGEYGTADLYDEQYKISQFDAAEYADAIELAIRRDRDHMDKTRGLAEYLDEPLAGKVVSLFPEFEDYGGLYVCVANITLSEPLTPDEMGELKQWWSGQLSDGWGEGFEQREIAVGNGDELYVVPWTSDDSFFLETEREFNMRLGYEIPDSQSEVVPLSPAEKALDEPDASDSPEVAAMRDRLIIRLDVNLSNYLDDLKKADSLILTENSFEIAAMCYAHNYLTHMHNFHPSEIEYLAQFRDPLKVVADEFEWDAATESRSDITWKVFHDQEALKSGKHELVPGTHTETGDAAVDVRKQELFDRLDANMSDYRKNIMSASKEDIFGMAEDIASRYAAREYMKTAYDFKTGEVEFLLQFQDPLSLIAENWPDMADAPVDIPSIIDIRGSHSHYAKVMDASNPASMENARTTPDAEKPSVMERIRDAARIPKEPRKDKTNCYRSGPEL